MKLFIEIPEYFVWIVLAITSIQTVLAVTNLILALKLKSAEVLK